MKTVYLVGPITSCSLKDTMPWRIRCAESLRAIGYTVLNPFTSEDKLKNAGVKSKKLDRKRVREADILLVNFLGSAFTSIGSVYELAWGDEEHCIMVLVMEKKNPHRHGWIEESASVVVETLEEGLSYLEELAKDWR